MKSVHLLGMFLGACILASCTIYGDAPVQGAVDKVSPADLHAAVAAVQSFRHEQKIYSIRVVNADEIWLYYTPLRDGSYWIARRTGGKWTEDGGMVVVE